MLTDTTTRENQESENSKLDYIDTYNSDKFLLFAI